MMHTKLPVRNRIYAVEMKIKTMGVRKTATFFQPCKKAIIFSIDNF